MHYICFSSKVTVSLMTQELIQCISIGKTAAPSLLFLTPPGLNLPLPVPALFYGAGKVLVHLREKGPFSFCCLLGNIWKKLKGCMTKGLHSVRSRTEGLYGGIAHLLGGALGGGMPWYIGVPRCAVWILVGQIWQMSVGMLYSSSKKSISYFIRTQKIILCWSKLVCSQMCYFKPKRNSISDWHV